MMPDLDNLFATAAAQTGAAPSDDLVARVLADASREQPRSKERPAPQPPGVQIRDFLAQLFQRAGVPAGLMAAAVAGFYLGFAPPAALLQLTDAVSGTSGLESVDLMPGVDALLSGDEQ